MQQPTEKRRNLRRAVTYPAFLDFGDGSPMRECRLCDASQEGAQLTVAEPKSLPEEFILVLSSDGAARRRCRVAWRTDAQVGVEFLKDGKRSPAPMRPQVTTALGAALLAGEAAAEPVPERVGIELPPR
jgi:hypothetical protein